VHRAHQTLIREARSLSDGLGAKLRVCTFDRHPLEVLRPEAAPGRLQTEREQAEAVAALGADELRIIPFTRETAETEPEDFLRRLSAECGLRGVVVGWNYTFGRGGRGTPETLRKAGEEQGFQVRVIDPVRTESGEYAADGVFVLREAVAPDTLVPGLETEGAHVKVNRKMETNLPGLFACGDLTGLPYQYVKAAGEGNVAAISAAVWLDSSASR
jgi:FAD synthase